MFIFQSARLRLSFWYVLITAVITLSFSFLIYRDISWELERGFRMAEHQLGGIIQYNDLARLVILQEQLIEAKKVLLLRLGFINGLILGITGLASYFLAGKTLAPIEEMMEDQKRFVDSASHELRTPLTSLRSEIEVALREKQISAKEVRALLKSNLEDVSKMQNLINYLLSLSRYQQNGDELKKSRVDITSIIEKVITEHTQKASVKNIDIVSSVNNISAEVHIVSFEELISILLDNAIKYTQEKGKITISAKRKNKGVILKIADTGVGISAKDLPHIFDRFFRADTSRSKISVDGYGLGLSIAKTIAEAHGGNISVKSKLSNGTSFSVFLP